MSPIEIVAIVFASALVIFTIAYNILRRKKGKTSCGCDAPSKSSGCSGCSGCAYSASCASFKKPENKEEK